MGIIEIVSAPATVIDTSIPTDLTHFIPPHLLHGQLQVSGMIYLYDEEGQAEGFGELHIYRCGPDCIRMDVSRDGVVMVSWENTLAGEPLFRSLVATVVRLREGATLSPGLAAVLPPPPQAYLLAAERLPHAPSRSRVHLVPDIAHE